MVLRVDTIHCNVLGILLYATLHANPLHYIALPCNATQCVTFVCVDKRSSTSHSMTFALRRIALSQRTLQYNTSQHNPLAANAPYDLATQPIVIYDIAWHVMTRRGTTWHYTATHDAACNCVDLCSLNIYYNIQQPFKTWTITIRYIILRCGAKQVSIAIQHVTLHWHRARLHYVIV